ncbi:MAG: thiamine pyrophosphate-dependent enzyme [Desulfurispora sp.]|uniref:thiamine pyrophosphate-dependent enzyme n=1 Tax=Desulfurispora sp. TaxID=3014275 RepID=UPI00404A6DDC
MFKQKPALLVEDNKYCPGCGHGIVNRLLAEVLEEMGLADSAIGVVAVGCACLMIDTFGVDWIQAQHGRAAAVATGIKRCRPQNPVFTYQGDGDALAIGLAETLYAAIRNEKITVLFVNNGVFGMTGGQMAPTTLGGQKTTTTPGGRDLTQTGQPLNVIEFLRTLPIAYLARGSVVDPAAINKTKEYLRRAFQAQLAGEGYSFVEIVSPCPTNWGLPPLKALEYLREKVLPVYRPGEFILRGGKKHD